MSINVNVDIDIDDILYSMGRRDMEKLLSELLEDMSVESIKTAISHLKDENKKLICVGLIDTNNTTLCEDSFNDSLSKLSANYISLKKEDQEIIEAIAKKY
jgi:hypothetical protein